MKTLKRKTAITLALCLILSVCFCVPVHAEGTTGKTTLTTTVPECTYNFSIPADLDIPFNQTETTVGRVTVYGVQQLGSRVIRVDIAQSWFLVSTTNSEDKISFTVFGTNEAQVDALGGRTETEWDASTAFGTASEIIYDNAHLFRSLTVKARINEDSWKSANPGTYEGHINFSFKVCSE